MPPVTGRSRRGRAPVTPAAAGRRGAARYEPPSRTASCAAPSGGRERAPRSASPSSVSTSTRRPGCSDSALRTRPQTARRGRGSVATATAASDDRQPRASRRSSASQRCSSASAAGRASASVVVGRVGSAATAAAGVGSRRRAPRSDRDVRSRVRRRPSRPTRVQRRHSEREQRVEAAAGAELLGLDCAVRQRGDGDDRRARRRRSRRSSTPRRRRRVTRTRARPRRSRAAHAAPAEAAPPGSARVGRDHGAAVHERVEQRRVDAEARGRGARRRAPPRRTALAAPPGGPDAGEGRRRSRSRRSRSAVDVVDVERLGVAGGQARPPAPRRSRRRRASSGTTRRSRAASTARPTAAPSGASRCSACGGRRRPGARRRAADAHESARRARAGAGGVSSSSTLAPSSRPGLQRHLRGTSCRARRWCRAARGRRPTGAWTSESRPLNSDWSVPATCTAGAEQRVGRARARSAQPRAARASTLALERVGRQLDRAAPRARARPVSAGTGSGGRGRSARQRLGLGPLRAQRAVTEASVNASAVSAVSVPSGPTSMWRATPSDSSGRRRRRSGRRPGVPHPVAGVGDRRRSWPVRSDTIGSARRAVGQRLGDPPELVEHRVHQPRVERVTDGSRASAALRRASAPRAGRSARAAGDDDRARAVDRGEVELVARQLRSSAPRSAWIASIAPPSGSACISRPRARPARQASSSESTPATCAAAISPTEWPDHDVGRDPEGLEQAVERDLDGEQRGLRVLGLGRGLVVGSHHITFAEVGGSIGDTSSSASGEHRVERVELGAHARRAASPGPRTGTRSCR